VAKTIVLSLSIPKWSPIMARKGKINNKLTSRQKKKLVVNLKNQILLLELSNVHIFVSACWAVILKLKKFEE